MVKVIDPDNYKVFNRKSCANFILLELFMIGRLFLYIKPIFLSSELETISICDKYFSRKIKPLFAAEIFKEIKKERLSNLSAERANGLLIIISIKDS